MAVTKKGEFLAEAPRNPLGDALVRDGVLTEEQLRRAQRVQQYLEQPRQLGQVLIELGYATKKQIAEVVSKHGAGMRFGEILLEQGLISEEQLERALQLQEEQGLKVGEALVELGAINERSLLQNLARQAGVPYIEPVFAMIDPEVLQDVSPGYLERYGFIPFSSNEEGYVTVVVNDLEATESLAAIGELYNEAYNLSLGPEDVIRQAISDFAHYREVHGRERDAKAEVGGDSAAQLIDHLLVAAVDDRASDIHFEPMSDLIRVRFRIDGMLVYKTDLPKDLLPRVTSRLKVLAECNITEHQRHQGGRILYTIKGREYDMRLSVYVTVHGECLVLRLLSKHTGLLSLEELGMSGPMLERYRTQVLDLPSGVVLITGPTGSGKTTTLYSSLNHCNSVDTKIITAEDPVEYMIDGLIQCSIYDKIGRTYEATLREIVRQDPDIIVLGEIRDRASAQAAIQAALTGHKVYSTFHTEDTIGGLLRLIDMDIETFLISSTVISVVAQRLLRRVCQHCAEPYYPNPIEVEQLGLDFNEVREHELKKGRGCSHCNYTGYYGRVGVYELLVVNDAVKSVILEKRPSHQIRKTCMESTGLISTSEDGVAKAIRGVTTFDEILRHVPRTPGIRPVRQILAMTQ
ncbi:MAG TPA: secretion system protein E [Candidatus Hydrogenedentes bacterium]|nr:secretion system protein E [Candidatus Hydrogenedentota bacterium]